MRFSFPRHPVVLIIAYGSLVVGAFGVYDFNRTIQLSEDDMKKFKSLHDLYNAAELVKVSQKLHFKAVRNVLEFRDITSNYNQSIEFFYLYKSVENTKLHLKNRPQNAGDSDEMLENEATENNIFVCQDMCRRALIRNGNVIKWFKLLVQDQFVQIYVMPVFLYFGMQYIKVNKKEIFKNTEPSKGIPKIATSKPNL